MGLTVLKHEAMQGEGNNMVSRLGFLSLEPSATVGIANKWRVILHCRSDVEWVHGGRLELSVLIRSLHGEKIR